MAEQPPDLLDVKIMSRALKELQHAFRVFQPYEHCLKVSIYGSARTPSDAPNFQLAARMGELLSRRGFMVITGAGPGIMEAGHQGAGKDMSFGVSITLPFEQAANSYHCGGDPKLVSPEVLLYQETPVRAGIACRRLFPRWVRHHGRSV